MNRNYPAFIIKDGNSFTISFPDLPGCLTFGPSIEEAFDYAREALEGHLAAMADGNMIIPEATPLDEVHPDEDDIENVVTKVLVPAVLPGKTVRTNISIDESLLASIDLVTQNRSSFFSEAARNELVRRRAGKMAEY